MPCRAQRSTLEGDGRTRGRRGRGRGHTSFHPLGVLLLLPNVQGSLRDIHTDVQKRLFRLRTPPTTAWGTEQAEQAEQTEQTEAAEAAEAAERHRGI